MRRRRKILPAVAGRPCGYSESVREQAAWKASDEIAGNTPARLRLEQAALLRGAMSINREEASQRPYSRRRDACATFEPSMHRNLLREGFGVSGAAYDER